MNILNVVEVVFVFSFMIFIHESGHFLASRFFGVEVEEFALGFGPTLFSRKWGKTLYAIRCVPLGGFCKMQGGDLSDQSVESIYSKPAAQGDYLFASWWKRVIILLAGPGMNFVSALVLIALLFIVKGEPLEVIQPVLGFVPPGSLAEKAGLQEKDLLLTVNGKEIKNLNEAEVFPDFGKSSVFTYKRGEKVYTATITRPEKPLSEWAASNNGFLKFLSSMGFGPAPQDETDLGISDFREPEIGQAVLGTPARNAGIQEGDLVTQVNGEKITDWSQLAYVIRNSKTDTLQIEFLRDKKPHTVTIQRIFNGSYKAIGISAVESKEVQMNKVSVLAAFGDSAKFNVDLSKKLLDGILKLVTGKISLKDNVSGPVTIMRLMYQQASQGWEDLINGVAVISLMLFLMNLLPIPVVDGGQIVLCVIEGIKRSPVSVKIQMFYQQVGFVLVLCLMVLAVFNDFKNIFLEFHNHIH